MSIDIAFVVTAGANLILASVALMQMKAFRRQADDSTLPVVVPHEVEQPRITDGGVHFNYRLDNEGQGLALNIEHGVELNGAMLSFGEGESPYTFRTLREEASAPTDSAGDVAPEGIDPLVLVAHIENPEAERVYWVRYETIHGRTYETRNSYDPSSNFTVHQIGRRRMLDWAAGACPPLRPLGRTIPRAPNWSGRRARIPET